jgi:hypothetical protein
MMQALAFAIPGVDEAMSFAEIMKYVTTTLCAPFRTYGWLLPLTYRLCQPKFKIPKNKRIDTSSPWNTP